MDGPLTVDTLRRVFADCVDFAVREADLAGDPEKHVTMCYIGGMVKLERASEYILRPLAQDSTLRDAPPEEAWRKMAGGALYNLMVEQRTTADQAALDIINGNLILFFPGAPAVLSFYMATEDKRSVSAPDNEPSIKGARDSFVENLRSNTSLVRRHLRAPELKIKEKIVGRQSLTPVDILWLDNIADPDLVRRVEERVAAIDIDALLSPAIWRSISWTRHPPPFPWCSIPSGPTASAPGWPRGGWVSWRRGCPWATSVPARRGSSSGPHRTRPTTG